MAKKDMCNFFHQRGAISLWAMRRIQDYEAPAIGQRPRTSAARPFIGGLAQQMLARFRRQSVDAVEIYHHQPGENGECEWIEWLIFGDTCEFTQPERAQLELFSLF